MAGLDFSFRTGGTARTRPTEYTYPEGMRPEPPPPPPPPPAPTVKSMPRLLSFYKKEMPRLRVPPKQIPRVQQAAAQKTCVKSLEALFVAGCVANPQHPDCATFVSNPENLAYLAMPLCPGEAQQPVPGCSDAELRGLVTYCDQHGVAGPDPQRNALCYSSKVLNPQRYAQLQQLSPCAGTPREPPGAEASAVDLDPVTAKRPNWLLWGGIAAAVVAVGGGVYLWKRRS